MTPEQLKASILQRAMEGKLVPQDPNDEPASKLLKRIKAEKEKLIKEGKIKRDKNETEIFLGDDGLHYEKLPDGSVKQIDVPYEIPESWEWGRLSSVVTLINGDRGKNYPSKDKLFSEGDIPFVNAGNINNNLIIQDNLLYLSQSQYDALGSGKLQYGDIVYCIRGSLGKNGLFTMPKGAIASSLIILRIIGDKSLNTDYFLSYLNSELCKNEILKFDNGTAQPNLSGQNLSKFLIPIPPFEEQLRISSMIKKALVLVNKYTTRYQMLNTLNRTFPEKLRKSILQYAMQGNLVPQDATDEPVEVLLEKIREEKQKLFAEGKLQKKDLQESIIYEGDDSSYKHIPKSWVLTTLGNVGFWRSGATPSRSNPLYFGGDIPWLKTGDLNDGYIYHIPENITALALKETSVKLIPSDSVLIAMYGATIGKIGILTFPATTNQACCACTPYNILNNQYLFWYLRFSRDKFIEMAEGGAQPNISKEKIVGFPIALPPIREQRKIVNKIECLIDKVSLL
jgi:restriction modification system DNA specificity domain protein